MASGVSVNPECLDKYQELKLGKKHRYILLGLSQDNKEIIVQKCSQSAVYDDFLSELSETECKWAIYDFQFEKEDGGKRNKLVFLSWSPDTAKIKQKMIFASSRDALKRALVGIAVEIQGTDFSEVAYDAVLDKANRGA